MSKKFHCLIHHDQLCVVSDRNPHAIYFDEPTITQQNFKDECDINQIIARASQGQDILHVNQRVAQYGDFSNVPSYQDALALVERAEGMFYSMSANVRERFANDPSKMVSFLQDPANDQEAIKLGLKEAPKVPPVAAKTATDPIPGDDPGVK